MGIIKKRIKPAFEDERGAIFDLVDNENISHIGLITSKKNSVRGKHYHKKAKQITYVLSGKIMLTAKDVRQKKSNYKTIIMEAGDIITIQPMVIHSIKALEDTIFLVFTDKPRSNGGYENDTYRISKIE